MNGLQGRICKIEKECGRIDKSMFVVSKWIIDTRYHIDLLRAKNNQKQLDKIYKLKHKAIKTTLETGLWDIRINKPTENNYTWLYVLSYNQEGLTTNLIVPYNEFRKLIKRKHDKLELTDIKEDCFILDGKVINCCERNIKLRFALENLEKSRKKLISKMQEEL